MAVALVVLTLTACDGGDSSKGTEAGSNRPTVRVTRVIDGDTVVATRLGKTRLIGIDTPEEGRCYETAATRFTRTHLEGHRVGYELGVEREDRYGRTLAYLYRGGMHNLALVEEGYAKALTIPPNDNNS
jgi:micrococcal nuclease